MPEISLLSLVITLGVPIFFWAGYHYYRDRHQPEPLLQTGIAFLVGIGAGALGQGMYSTLPLLGLWFDPYTLAETDRFGLLLYSVFGIGLIEEVAKFIPFLLLIRWLSAFDEPVDGIIYAAFIALGFASYENFFYLGFLTPSEQLGRGVTAPLIHAMFASLWGYTVSRAWFAKKPIVPAIAKGLATAIVLHGVYNFLIFDMRLGARLLAAGIILAIWFWRMHLIERVLAVKAKPGDSTMLVP